MLQKKMENSLLDSDLGTAKIYGTRQLQGKEKLLVTIVATLFSLIVGIWTNSFGILQSVRQGGLFVGFLLFLAFLLYPSNAKSSRREIPIIDWFCAILGAAGGFYTFFYVEAFATKPMPFPTNLDMFFGVVTVLLLFEAARRVAGKWISIICAFFIFYALFGQYFPGIFAHRGISFQRLIIRLYLVDEGIYGIITRIGATYVFLFIIFGAFLQESGVSDFFNKFALALTGAAPGGPAKVAVVASAIMGTISGSGVANVVTTGSFTIPLMKRVGYKPHFAGAVEAAASTGGQFMPPIMCSVAFIMSEFLGISYIKIVIAGIIPAILYYTGVYFDVHYEALKSNLKGLPKDELPNLKEILLKKSHLTLPVFILFITLIIGFSPTFSAFLAIISTILVSQFRKDTRMGLKSILSALNRGGQSVVVVGTAVVACGSIIAVLTISGIGQVVAYNIISLSHNILIVALMFIMVASIILSMGMPGTAIYIVVATVCAPALIRMGVLPIAAHFFCFYFGSLSNLTPPIALASYAAAALSGASLSKVAWTGLRLVLPAFIVPYVFVYSPMLLSQNIKFPGFLILLFTTFLAVWSFSLAERGYYNRKLNYYQRIPFLFASIFLINTNYLVSIIGLFGLIILLILNRKKEHKGII